MSMSISILPLAIRATLLAGLTAILCCDSNDESIANAWNAALPASLSVLPLSRQVKR